MTTLAEPSRTDHDQDVSLQSALQSFLHMTAMARCELEELRMVALDRIDQMELHLAEIERDLNVTASHHG